MNRLTVTVMDSIGRVLARGEIPRDWAEGTRDGTPVSIRCDSPRAEDTLFYLRIDITPTPEPRTDQEALVDARTTVRGPGRNSEVPRSAPGCTCGTPPFAPPEPASDCPYHGGVTV